MDKDAPRDTTLFPADPKVPSVLPPSCLRFGIQSICLGFHEARLDVSNVERRVELVRRMLNGAKKYFNNDLGLPT